MNDPTATEGWVRNSPLIAMGAVAIVAGGLAAAVTGPTDWEHGSWVAAFLVLVAGVAQVGFGICQSVLVEQPPSARSVAAQGALWNAGCALVIVGTLVSNSVVVSIGGAPLVAALLMAAGAARGPARHPRFVLAYRAMLIVLLVSIPIGLALSWTR